MGFKLEQFNNPKVRAQIVAQLAGDVATAIVTGNIEIIKKQRKRIMQEQEPVLNGLETKYRNRLKDVYPSQTIYEQAFRFKLSNGGWYKPDLAMFSPDGLVCWECKGPYAWRANMNSLKTAAYIYKEVKFYLVSDDGGSWNEQRILS